MMMMMISWYFSVFVILTSVSVFENIAVLVRYRYYQSRPTSVVERSVCSRSDAGDDDDGRDDVLFPV